MKRQYKLENLGCANCAAKMEHEISKLTWVYSVSINFLTTKLVVEFEDNMKERIQTEIEKIVHKYEDNVILKRV